MSDQTSPDERDEHPEWAKGVSPEALARFVAGLTEQELLGARLWSAIQRYDIEFIALALGQYQRESIMGLLVLVEHGRRFAAAGLDVAEALTAHVADLIKETHTGLEA